MTARRDERAEPSMTWFWRRLDQRVTVARFKAFAFLRQTFSDFNRGRRTARFAREFLKGGANPTIVDLGGDPDFWRDIAKPLQITIVNLPDAPLGPCPPQHDITIVAADACAVDALEDGAFDIVFSNSVIEHVGDRDRVAQFAREARRLGRAHWIQTPSKWFPFEAHCGMPFWWFYPERVRRRFMEHWRRKIPEWTEMMDGVTVLERRELETLFPDSRIYEERFMLFPKSYVVLRR